MRASKAVVAIGVAMALTAPLELSAASRTSLTATSEQWRVVSVPNRKATKFAIDRTGTMNIRSDMSVAFFVREMKHPQEKVGANTIRNISWQWRVDGDIVVTDLAHKGGDDRPAAIHLFFGKRQQQAGLFGNWFKRFPPDGFALSYVWGGKRKAETVIDNPYFDNGKIIIVRTAKDKAGTWRREKRDIAADLRRAFGDLSPLGSLRYVAVSGDTDDTQSQSSAKISNLRITPHTP